MKKINNILFIMLSVFLLSGCTITHPERDAKEHFSKKWGIDCEPYYVDEDNNHWDQVYCVTPGMNKDEEYITVTVGKNQEEGKTYDNYFGYYIKEDAERYISNLLNINADTKIYYYKDLKYDNSLNTKSTYEDMLNTESISTQTFKVFIKKDANTSIETLKSKIDAFVLRVKSDLDRYNSKITYSMVVFILSDDTFNKVSRYDVSSVTTNKTELDGVLYRSSYDISKEKGIEKIK